MRLIGNKKDIIENKVMDNICWKERNLRESNNNILYKQDISIRRLITLNVLMNRIYNEINR
jgi:hypothetical protein